MDESDYTEYYDDIVTELTAILKAELARRTEKCIAELIRISENEGEGRGFDGDGNLYKAKSHLEEFQRTQE